MTTNLRNIFGKAIARSLSAMRRQDDTICQGAGDPSEALPSRVIQQTLTTAGRDNNYPIVRRGSNVTRAGWRLWLPLFVLVLVAGAGFTGREIQQKRQDIARRASIEVLHRAVMTRIGQVNPNSPVLAIQEFSQWLMDIEAETGTDYRLLLAVMEVECVSSRGALGPFQLMPETAKAFAAVLNIPYVPAEIRWGTIRGARAPLRIRLGTAGDLQSAGRIAAEILRSNSQKHGVSNALLIYAMGEGGWKNGRKNEKLAHWYVDRVFDRYLQLAQLPRDKKMEGNPRWRFPGPQPSRPSAARKSTRPMIHVVERKGKLSIGERTGYFRQSHFSLCWIEAELIPS